MFDIGAQEILVIVVVAVIVIGPKELPTALRTAGRWIAKMRRLSGHFRSGLDAMIREAELEDLEKKWKEQNEKIMREHPNGGPEGTEQTGAYPAAIPSEPEGPPPELAERVAAPAPAAPEEAIPAPAEQESLPLPEPAPAPKPAPASTEKSPKRPAGAGSDAGAAGKES